MFSHFDLQTRITVTLLICMQILPRNALWGNGFGYFLLHTHTHGEIGTNIVFYQSWMQVSFHYWSK